MLRAPWEFAKAYFLRGGWLDGWAGLHASFLVAFAVGLRELQLWGLTRPAIVHSTGAREESHNLRVFNPASQAANAEDLNRRETKAAA